MIERIKTRASDFEQCGEIASVLIKEKRLGRFSPLDFIRADSEQWSFAVHPFIFIKNRVIYHFVNDI